MTATTHLPYAPHHHRDRKGRHIDDRAWRALRKKETYCVMRECKRATETIQAVWHGEGESYDFAIRIRGGKAHGRDIHCRTEASVLALFDSILAARKLDVCHPFLRHVDVDHDHD